MYIWPSIHLTTFSSSVSVSVSIVDVTSMYIVASLVKSIRFVYTYLWYNVVWFLCLGNGYNICMSMYGTHTYVFVYRYLRIYDMHVSSYMLSVNVCDSEMKLRIYKCWVYRHTHPHIAWRDMNDYTYIPLYSTYIYIYSLYIS